MRTSSVNVRGSPAPPPRTLLAGQSDNQAHKAMGLRKMMIRLLVVGWRDVAATKVTSTKMATTTKVASSCPALACSIRAGANSKLPVRATAAIKRFVMIYGGYLLDAKRNCSPASDQLELTAEFEGVRLKIDMKWDV